MLLFQQIDSRSFNYRVDARSRIVAVNDAWLDFAAENDWPIVRADVLGRPLLGFIADEHLQYLYGLLLARVRTGHGPLRFRYRCDAPQARRLMEMRLLYDKRLRQIEFQSRVLRIDRRTPQELLRKDRPDDGRCVDICSHCKRIDLGGSWAEVEDAVLRLQLFDNDHPPCSRHCVCPDCARQLSTLGKSRRHRVRADRSARSSSGWT